MRRAGAAPVAALLPTASLVRGHSSACLCSEKAAPAPASTPPPSSTVKLLCRGRPNAAAGTAWPQLIAAAVLLGSQQSRSGTLLDREREKEEAGRAGPSTARRGSDASAGAVVEEEALKASAGRPDRSCTCCRKGALLGVAEGDTEAVPVLLCVPVMVAVPVSVRVMVLEAVTVTDELAVNELLTLLV